MFLDAGGVLVQPGWQRVSAAFAAEGISIAAESLRTADPLARRDIDESTFVGGTTDQTRGWEYFNRVLGFFGVQIPYEWVHSPMQVSTEGTRGIINLPAVFILLLLTMLLVRGTRESAFVNNLIVITKVTIVLLVIVLGWSFIDPANHTPLIPEATMNDIYCGDRSRHIYAAGGTGGATMWQYDIATNTWSPLPDLPADHSNNGSCLVSDGGYLYVTPGANRQFYRLPLD